jgi:hypothetical protein
MRICTSIACAMLLLPLIAFAWRNATEDFVVHGTINIALGNENGLVVLTDSMVTAGGHQLPEPGQKLFKLDDSTVCSIAGFASARAASNHAAVPDLNTSISAIIHEYVQQSAQQAPQRIDEKLRALAGLINFYLSTIATVRDALGNATGVDSYRFQLIVAGYDLDDNPKIGRITLRTENERGSFSSKIEDASISNVENKLVWQLNGMPGVARQILLHPESRPNDPVLHEYATSLSENGGKSLTVEQMVDLAKRLAYYTSQLYPEVGGPNQIAILQKRHSLSIEQQKFPEPPRPLFKFALAVNSHFTFSSVAWAKGVPVVFVRCSWIGMQRELDGNYFIGNDFKNSFLLYDGGIVNLGDTNRVIDSVLVIGPHVKPDDETVRRLAKAFSWSRIVRAEPNTTP